MMEILVLMILVAPLRDVFPVKKFVTTTIFVPPILVMLILEFVTMSQQTVMIITNVLPKNVVYKLAYVYIRMLTAMIKTLVQQIVALLIMDVVILRYHVHLLLVWLEDVTSKQVVNILLLFVMIMILVPTMLAFRIQDVNTAPLYVMIITSVPRTIVMKDIAIMRKTSVMIITLVLLIPVVKFPEIVSMSPWIVMIPICVLLILVMVVFVKTNQ
jgi:hypothetical protein